jgi:protein-S-isoprenylcysteine O-methyltransferase Ste14
MISRALALLYGTVAYVFFVGTFLYAVGFLMDFGVPKSVEDGVEAPLGTALLVDLALLGLFGLQHSIMARPAFKRWWTTLIPKAIERSTFVLVTNLVLSLLFWQWRPLPQVIWETDAQAASVILRAFACGGWIIALLSTWIIDHFELFGLKQVWQHFRGQPAPPVEFRERWFYRYVRHPLMAGFIIAFWSTPRMTLGHLVFALVATAYILVAIQLEERDLLREHGEAYDQYRRRVSMLFPLPGRPREV